MFRRIPEPDWRHFKRVREELLERFCAGVLEELGAIVASEEGTAHERYLQSYRLLQARGKELANAFNDVRRSTAILQLAVMRHMGLLTDQHLSVFSEETQQAVRAYESLG